MDVGGLIDQVGEREPDIIGSQGGCHGGGSVGSQHIGQPGGKVVVEEVEVLKDTTIDGWDELEPVGHGLLKGCLQVAEEVANAWEG